MSLIHYHEDWYIGCTSDSDLEKLGSTPRSSTNIIKLNQVTTDNNIRLSVSDDVQFTIQITDAEGYVDGVANYYTAALLDGAHIGMTKKKVESDNAEFKLDWDIEIARDLDSHMVIKNSNGEQIGHVDYGNKMFSDTSTSVTLDIDNVSRSDQRPPEIMSIDKINPAYTYYYYVHDFNTTQKLPKSNLNLNVVIKNETVDPAIAIPTADNVNCYWNACKIQNGVIVKASDILTETVTDTPNVQY